MIAQDVWDSLISVATWIWVPVGGIITWVWNKYQAHTAQTDDLEKRVGILEMQHTDMKEDLVTIKNGVDSLVSHLLNKK